MNGFISQREVGITLQMSMEASPDINVVPGINAPKQMLHLVKTTPGSLFYGARFYMHGYVNNTNLLKKVITVWSPDDEKVGISNYFRAVGQPILSDKIPPINPKNKELFVSEAPKYGINQSKSFDQYVSGTDYNFPQHSDNHEPELLSLLSNDGKCNPPTAITTPNPSQINLTSRDVNLVPELTTNLATKLALTAVNYCAAKGINVSATVVNKDGAKQVVIRGNNAPPHTVDFSYSKAYSVVTLAVTQNLNTTRELAERFAKDPVKQGVFTQPGILLLTGGMAIRNANNQVIAGLGVAGAANSKDEEECAIAGLNEIKKGI